MLVIQTKIIKSGLDGLNIFQNFLSDPCNSFPCIGNASFLTLLFLRKPGENQSHLNIYICAFPFPCNACAFNSLFVIFILKVFFLLTESSILCQYEHCTENSENFEKYFDSYFNTLGSFACAISSWRKGRIV